MEPSVIFLQRFALKWAILKSCKMFELADTCNFEIYLKLRVTLCDEQMDNGGQITDVTQLTQRCSG